MRTSEVLNKAADHIQEHGWWQAGGRGGAGDEPKCAANAILKAGDGTLELCVPAWHSLADYLGLPRTVASIFPWNDTEGRTAAEVIEVLRACAVIEASREREAAEVSA